MAKTTRTRAEWSKWVQKWRASGLSGTEFATRHGLSQGSLYRWGRLLEDDDGVEVEAGTKPPMRFAEVQVRDVGSKPRAGVLELVSRSGWVVRLVGEVDVEQLRAVLEVVETC